MKYIYEICPRCMDELIERKQPIEDQESINYCPKCGRKMEGAIGGEQRIDDTTYKIILNDASSLTDYMDQKNSFIKELMKIGNFTFDEASEKCRTKDSVIFEGDTRETYINIGSLHGWTFRIEYTVVPEFPFSWYGKPFFCICPDCGSDTIYKSGGVFCEKCNDWVLFPPC